MNKENAPPQPSAIINHQAELLGKTQNFPPLPPKPIGTLAPMPPPIPVPLSHLSEEYCHVQVNCHVATKRTSQSRLIQMISLIIKIPKKKPVNPPFNFDCNKSVAIHNWETIAKFGSFLENTLQSFKNSPIHYGSEFKPVCILAPILKHHKCWSRLKEMLSNGSTFSLEEHDKDLRKDDLEQALEYGNHKSADKNIDILSCHVKNEIEKGWIVPLLPEYTKLLRNLMISPMGVVSQSTINDRGEIIPPNRVTHNISFPGILSGLSINSK
jgi:hypothetical protein